MQETTQFHQELSSFITGKLAGSPEFREYIKSRVVAKLMRELEAKKESEPSRSPSPLSYTQRFVNQKLCELAKALKLLEQALTLLSHHDIRRKSMLMREYPEEGRSKRIDVGAFYSASILVTKLETEASAATRKGFDKKETAGSIERFAGTIRTLIRLGKSLNKSLSELNLTNLVSTSSIVMDFVILVKKVSSALVDFPILELAPLVSSLQIFSENVAAPLIQLSKKWEEVERKAIERMEMDLIEQRKPKISYKSPTFNPHKGFLLSTPLRMKRSVTQLKKTKDEDAPKIERFCQTRLTPEKSPSLRPKQKRTSLPSSPLRPSYPQQRPSSSGIPESGKPVEPEDQDRESAGEFARSSEPILLNEHAWDKLVRAAVMSACMELDEACDGAVERMINKEMLPA